MPVMHPDPHQPDLQIALAPLYRDLVLIKWMMGVLLGGVAALILKSFFPT